MRMEARGRACPASGAKLRAIRRCIDGLNEDIGYIIARGLSLAHEIDECVYESTSSSCLDPPARRRHTDDRPCKVPKAGQVSRSCHFPAIERGLRAKDRMLARAASPLRDLTNLVESSSAQDEDEDAEIARKSRERRARRERELEQQAAAVAIQRSYRSLRRRRSRSATVIQSRFRALLSEREASKRRESKFRAERAFLEWSRRARVRSRLGREAAERSRRHGRGAHLHLGSGFDGECIRPVEGVYAMAREYQLWRIKAATFVRWTEAFQIKEKGETSR